MKTFKVLTLVLLLSGICIFQSPCLTDAAAIAPVTAPTQNSGLNYFNSCVQKPIENPRCDVRPAPLPSPPPPPPPKPLLTITKTAPEMRLLGATVRYNITVRSTGDATAVDATVSDAVPEGTTFLSASDDGEHNDGIVTWKLGDLEPNDERVVKMTVKAMRIGTIPNTATVRSETLPPIDATASTIVKGIPAILLEVVDETDPIEVGGVVVYRITVTNQGTAVGNNIAVTATLPKQMEFVLAKGPTEGKAEGQVITYVPLPALEPKAEVVWYLHAKAIDEGDIRFKIQLVTDQSPEPVSETESTNLYK